MSEQTTPVPAANGMRRRIILGVAAGLSGVLILVGVTYLRDMQRAYARVSGRTTVIPSPYGDIEYAEGGRGPDVLVIHGSGGGFDQGELLVQAFLGDDFHWIAPSRFGYLRSNYQDGATFVDQAHAYAALLDHLGVEKVAVVTISHGGPSALLFALLYPERVSSLTLLSTGVTAIDAGAQVQASQQGSMLAAIFKYDWLYWGVTKLFKRQFMALMGANDAVIAELTPAQRQLVGPGHRRDESSLRAQCRRGVRQSCGDAAGRDWGDSRPDADHPCHGRHAAAIPECRICGCHDSRRQAHALRAGRPPGHGGRAAGDSRRCAGTDPRPC
ncbi:MAG: alpha/beta hydrolase [Caldilineaceae bacterium]